MKCSNPAFVLAMLGFMAAGCVLQPVPTGPVRSPKPRPAEASPRIQASAPAILAPNAAGVIGNNGGSLIGKVKAIADALADTLAAADVAQAQGVVGIISHNGGNLISNNGGSLISDKGGGLIGKTKYALAQASPAPSASPAGPIEWTHRDGETLYVNLFTPPGYGGEIKGYEAAAFDAQGQSAPLVEHYTWPSLTMVPLSFSLTPPIELRVTYPAQIVKSRTIQFTRRIDLEMDITVTAQTPKLLTRFRDMRATFAVEVPVRGGGTEAITVKSTSFTYPPGAGPAEMTGTTYPTPVGLTATGQSARGELTMKVDNASADPAVRQTLEATFKRADGAVVTLKQTAYKDGRSMRSVVDAASGVEAIVTYRPGEAGTGEVRENGQAIATVRWDGTGNAEIGAERLRLF